MCPCQAPASFPHMNCLPSSVIANVSAGMVITLVIVAVVVALIVVFAWLWRWTTPPVRPQGNGRDDEVKDPIWKVGPPGGSGYY
jgi:hypothetical protein